MARQYTSLPDMLKHGFDTVVDVRSPAEFADDHIPGAINLPALTNEERAEVGTLYKQVSPFLARKVGASLVLKNISVHMAGPLSDLNGGWQPLLYCWRGGQRSGVFTSILKEVGWRADVIKGGYQSYRRLVNAALYTNPIPHPLVLLDGYTGTAKTELLGHLDRLGVQILDLENLAQHRGSLLGELEGGQPSQRMFETRLAYRLSELSFQRPVVVEAESSQIGRINLPPSLWTAMRTAPRVTVTASIDARALYLSDAYDAILRDPQTITRRLAPLRRLRGHSVVDGWKNLQASKDYVGLAKALIKEHYDPAYAKSRRSETHPELGIVPLPDLSEARLSEAAQEIKSLLDRSQAQVSRSEPL